MVSKTVTWPNLRDPIPMTKIYNIPTNLQSANPSSLTPRKLYQYIKYCDGFITMEYGHFLFTEIMLVLENEDSVIVKITLFYVLYMVRMSPKMC
jgi:hypothetical protein